MKQKLQYRGKLVLILALTLNVSALAAGQAGAAPASEIDSVTVFPGKPQTIAGVDQNTFLLEIVGKGLANVATIIPFPANGVSDMTLIATSKDGTELTAKFTAPPTYALQQIALTLGDKSFLTYNSAAASCDFSKNVTINPQIVPEEQVKEKYGTGVSRNFCAVQLSPVSKCSMPIDIPLAGIKIQADGSLSDKGEDCKFPPATNLIPFSLDHLTSIYTVDRQYNGNRAIYFNVLQAVATLGSAVEPFLAKGFTQAVAIIGGGFTTASKQILVDMSAQQLQDIATQSFPATEQIAANGSDQKYVFVRKVKGCADSTLEANLRQGNFLVYYEILQASAQPPATQTAAATPPAKIASNGIKLQ